MTSVDIRANCIHGASISRVIQGVTLGERKRKACALTKHAAYVGAEVAERGPTMDQYREFPRTIAELSPFIFATPSDAFAQKVLNPTHGSGWIPSVTTYMAITPAKKSHQRQLVDFSIAASLGLK